MSGKIEERCKKSSIRGRIGLLETNKFFERLGKRKDSVLIIGHMFSKSKKINRIKTTESLILAQDER